MSIESDKLRDLVDNVYPVTITNLNTSLTQLDLQLTELNSQKSAVEYGMSQATLDQNTLLEAKGYDLEAYGSDYGVVNLSDFYLGNLITTDTITFVDVDTFTVIGDLTSTFTNGLALIVDCGVDGYKIRTVDSSSFDSVLTEVVLVVDATQEITSNITDVYELLYEYNGIGWDSDVNIIDLITYFAESYEHLNQPLGTSGTYGLNDKIAKITTGKNILEIDKAKYEDLIIAYEKYAT